MDIYVAKSVRGVRSVFYSKDGEKPLA